MSGIKHCPNLLERATEEKKSTGMRLLTFLQPLHASCSPSCCTAKLWFMTSAWIIAFFNNKAKGMKEPRSTKSPLKTAEKERKQKHVCLCGCGTESQSFRIFFASFCCCLQLYVQLFMRLCIHKSVPACLFIGGKGTSWTTWNPRGTRDWPSGTQGKVCYPILLEN